MSVVIDTTIWSEFYRRAAPKQDVHEALKTIVAEGGAVLLGPVRQELLSGIKDARQFSRLRAELRAFSNEPITLQDYEAAASFYNICRTQGLQGSNTEFLICAVSVRLVASIFTLDQDFEIFARILPIKIYSLESRS